MAPTEIRPFTVDVPQADIEDLHARLDRARWTDEIPGSDGAYGVTRDWVQRLADPAELQGMTSGELGALLANVATTSFTGTAGSSLRFSTRTRRPPTRRPGPTTAPTALAASVDHFRSIRRFAERDHSNIVSWNVYDEGGHNTAHTDPELLATDVSRFFDELR